MVAAFIPPRRKTVLNWRFIGFPSLDPLRSSFGLGIGHLRSVGHLEGALGVIPAFSYDEAFSRNIGWVSAAEQQKLRSKRVAIAGLGGVGGSHLLTLTRLGIGAFHIADFDTFDIPNFNRQAGATTSTLGRQKSEVLSKMARDINPELKVTVFEKGIDEQNVGAFLDGVDLYIDGLDFFAFSARKIVFPACAQRNIPATTAAPLGMGAALLNFLPGGMTFEEYFRWNGCSDEEMALRFLIGLSPAGLHRSYLVDPATIDLKGRKGPSTPMACELCAGMAGTQALKILLNRGDIVAAPRGMHFDAYRGKMVQTWRPGGNRNPIQRLAIFIATRQIARMRKPPASASEMRS
jgi:sulfur-carrier protein adenylyltransferase/sulfurtransferase